jgi:tRNA pseudouridine13 synthase
MLRPKDAPTAQPYLTADRAGCDGVLKRLPEDFIVDEVPAYLPSGEGEHIYVQIEKRGLSTPQVVEHLRAAFRLPPSAVGYAGLKDAQAVSRQWLSLHSHGDLPLQAAERPGLRVLATSRHGNKLRRGHLRGNRFEILVRNARRESDVAATLEFIARWGFPNYYGEQRYGRDGMNAERGKALLLGGQVPGGRVPSGKTGGGAHNDRQRFAINAYQSALFDELVAQRLRSLGNLHTLVNGDLPVLHGNGAAFHVSTLTLEATQPRADAGEISPSAPLFGYRVELAAGQPGEWERAVLQREGLTPESFRLRSKGESPGGERRAVRAIPAELEHDWFAEPDGPALRLRFTLPPGAYATSLLREVMKVDSVPELPVPEPPAPEPPEPEQEPNDG